MLRGKGVERVESMYTGLRALAVEMSALMLVIEGEGVCIIRY